LVLEGVVTVKEYVNPTVELVSFKSEKIFAESTSCKCFGEVLKDEKDIDENPSCYATTYDNIEVIQAELPWGVYPA